MESPEVTLTFISYVMTFDGAEMNESMMTSGVDVDELVTAVVVEREVAVANESLMSSGCNDEKLGTQSSRTAPLSCDD